MTMTGGSISSTCCGTTGPARTASPASCCRSTRRRSERLVGERRNIFTGTALGFTEAPHLYKRDGWYYLITAEGGTGWGHAVTMARSRTLLGPYELHPDVHILSARHRPDVALQRAGHADLVETQAGETYMVYLCGRPLANRGRCTLGRETAIQPMTWGADGWLRTDRRRRHCRQLQVPAPAGLPPQPHPRSARARGVRRPDAADRVSMVANACSGRSVQPARAAWLPAAVRPRDASAACSRRRSWRGGSRRTASAHRRSWSSSPQHFQQMAGLVCYYNSTKFHYLYLVARRGRQAPARHVGVAGSVSADAFTPPIPIAEGVPIELRVEVDYERLRFAYRVGGQRVAVAAAAVRREHPLGRGDRARAAELHRRVRRHGVPGLGRYGEAGGLRLVRIPRAPVRR